MNRLLASCILPMLFTLTSVPALAKDVWYAALGVTHARIAESDQRIANAPAPGATLVTRNQLDRGSGWNLAVGRGFGHFRAEVEFGRFDNESKAFAITSPFTATVSQRGEVEVQSLSLNGYWDFGTEGTRLRPFLGLGLGRAKVSMLRIAGLANNPAAPPFRHQDDDASGFAWHASAGLNLRLSEHLALSARYRRFDAGDYEIHDSRGERVRGDTRANLFDLALRVSF